MVFDDSLHRVHGLQPDERVRRRVLERGIECGGKLLVARHGHVVPELLRGIGRDHSAARFQAARACGAARGQLCRTDEGVEGAGRPAREVGECAAALVGSDVRIAADVEQDAL